jgi:HSP20 family protein
MEDEDTFRLRIDMPGLNKEEVKVTVEDGDLIIKGEHNAEGKEDEHGWSSRSYGSYHTRLTLPDHVKHDAVKAELKNGVLHVEMPKSKEEPKKNAIEIEVN